MNKDFAKMGHGMQMSTGSGLSGADHDRFYEVRGQLEKGLKVCNAERTSNCISVEVTGGDNAQVTVAAGGGDAEEEETKSQDGSFHSFSSSSSSAGSHYSFGIPFSVSEANQRKVAYNSKDGTFDFKIYKAA